MRSAMTSTRWGALAFMAGSALFLANKLDELSLHLLSRPMPDVISGDSTALILFGQVVFATGFVAYYRFYAPRLGRVGRFALGLFAGGGIVLMLGHLTFMRALAPVGPLADGGEASGVEALYVLVILGGFSMLAGAIAFGVVSLRQPVLARWRWLQLATGMALLGFFALGAEDITVPFLVARTLLALGLFGLGLAMWLDRPTPGARAPVGPGSNDG